MLQSMSGGYTNKANAEYRSLQQHLVDEHDIPTADVSGKRVSELKALHDHLIRAERGEIPIEEESYEPA